MKIRNLLAFTFSTLLCAGLSSQASAQPDNFGVTPERVAQLEAMHEQAMNYLVQNDFQAAIRAYSDILLMEPDDETAYTGLGQIYAVQGHFKKANDAFQSALNINPYNQVALMGIKSMMDPDGVEGMVSANQAVDEPAPLSAPAPLALNGMEKRQGAVKAKKGLAPFFAPAPAPAPMKRRTARMGKLSLLHAQRLQMALKKSGFYKGPVNGMIGARTKNAVKQFQKNFGIQPSGRFTSATWSKLSEYLVI